MEPVAAATMAGQAIHLDSGIMTQTPIHDINPLSNFVADAASVIGFDPFDRFVDVLLDRASTRKEEPS